MVSGFRVYGLGLWVRGPCFSGCRVLGVEGFRVSRFSGLGLGVLGFGL